MIGERLVTSMIVLNLPVAAWVELTHDELAEHIDAGILVFFAIEIGVRVALAVKRREWDNWLVVDSIIVLLAMLPFGAIPVVRVARLVHVSRHAGHLRHLTIARVIRVPRLVRV
jgi:hypothetical protein